MARQRTWRWRLKTWGFFVFEVNEDVASRGEVFLHASDHRVAFVRRVTRFAVAIVGEVGGDDVRRGALFGFGYAEGDIALPKRIPGGIG